MKAFGSVAIAAMLLGGILPSASAAGTVPAIEEEEGSFGFLFIREQGINTKATMEPYDMSGETLGILKISPFKLPSVTKQENDDIISPSAQAILSEIQPVEDAHKEGDWKTALMDMRVLQNNHPDLPFFGKWVAIYQNRTHDCKGSLATIASLREAWPLEKDVQNSFVFDYYVLDNVRQLGDMQTADRMLALMRRKLDGMKTPPVKDGSLDAAVKDKEIASTLLDYQELMLSKDATGEADKKKLDALWEKIPKKFQKNLDRFAGFDLSELGYLYGMTYARKDVLNAYVRQKEYDYDEGVISRVKAAKNVIFAEN